MEEEFYYNDDYYFIGDFMDTASFTFEKDCTYYWCMDITEPIWHER